MPPSDPTGLQTGTDTVNGVTGQRQLAQNLGHETRRARTLAFVVAIAFFGGFGLWASLAPLASAVIATGIVNPDGARKTIQHLDGGIIARILVARGESVAAGQRLVLLDTTRADMRLAVLRDQLIPLWATKARLRAEIDENDDITFVFPPDLGTGTADQIAAARQSAARLFQTRRAAQGSHARIIAARVAQFQAEITGLHNVIAAQDDELRLLGTELAASQALFDQGLQRIAPVVTLQRQAAALHATRAANHATIIRLGQQIGEAEQQIIAMRQQTREALLTELAAVQAEIAALQGEMAEWTDFRHRAVITAPVAGQVLDIKVTTEGSGVLPPGGAVIDLVPSHTRLVIDARISPQDIDSVAAGMPARIMPTTYAARIRPPLQGILQSVSADRLTDPRTGEAYFLGRVSIEPGTVPDPDDIAHLRAGVPVEVMIITGDHTVLNYLLGPLTASLRRALREG